MIDGDFTNSRGVRPFKRTILPDNRQPKGLVVFHHGFTDHCSRHIHVLTPLTAAGFAVVAYDAYGHGRSGPASPWLRSYIRNFNDLVVDLIEFVEYTRDQYPDVPVFVMGHSMGGAAAALAACRRPSLFAGVILSSPVVQIQARSWKSWAIEWMIWGLNWTVPGLTYLRVLARQPVEWGMNDKQAVLEMKDDRYRDALPHRLGSIASLMQAARMMHSEGPAGLAAMPLYIQQGTADVATRREWLVDWTGLVLKAKARLRGSGSGGAKRASSTYQGSVGDSVPGALDGMAYFEVPGGYHDLNHDTATPECLARLSEWLTAQLSVQQRKGRNT